MSLHNLNTLKYFHSFTLLYFLFCRLSNPGLVWGKEFRLMSDRIRHNLLSKDNFVLIEDPLLKDYYEDESVSSSIVLLIKHSPRDQFRMHSSHFDPGWPWRAGMRADDKNERHNKTKQIKTKQNKTNIKNRCSLLGIFLSKKKNLFQFNKKNWVKYKFKNILFQRWKW